MIIPVRDLVYIIPFEAPRKSVIIDTSVRDWEKPTQGIVKYRGPLTTGEIRVGDHVVFASTDGFASTIEGEGELIVMREFQIQAKMNDEPANYIVSLEKVNRLILSAGREVAGLIPISDQPLLHQLIERVQAQIPDILMKDLYF